MDIDRIRAGLAGTRFRDVEVRESLPSTQTLLVSEGGPDGRVVVADHQTAGRGRAGRTWTAEPGAGLLFSALLRGLPADRAPLVSLQAGVAVARALERLGLRPSLKWPNDVLLDGRKLGGILGELAPGAAYVVVGIGINVRGAPAGLDATSLREAGVEPRRDDLLVSVLRELHGVLDDGDFLDAYRRRCSTIGSTVRVELSDGVLTDVAAGVRDDGALLVGGRAVVSGDVVHVRPVASSASEEGGD